MKPKQPNKILNTQYNQTNKNKLHKFNIILGTMNAEYIINKKGMQKTSIKKTKSNKTEDNMRHGRFKRKLGAKTNSPRIQTKQCISYPAINMRYVAIDIDGTYKFICRDIYIGALDLYALYIDERDC